MPVRTETEFDGNLLLGLFPRTGWATAASFIFRTLLLGYGFQGEFDVFDDVDPVGGARKPSVLPQDFLSTGDDG